ncbi:hypothetical protein [Gelidibacter maritimus]|uniref:Uncharacterized protein n=1 Tax=Gelidibacter maritimus TaxID=2761487 RepID=A0A7W2M721_9FLAO|nr:hypothetical protein [Gelidibacter maritimus]MBA6153937.1 hypothetical protein [Gelidibacter maritimus]
MKIKDKFPNYTPSLMFYIRDKNPVLCSNDSILYAYFIPLANFKKGFDYYELKPHKSGGVYFSLATMIGFRTILTTESRLFQNDISEREWAQVIGEITTTHFLREEYRALSRGYVKKGGGCFSTVLLTFFFGILLFTVSYIKIAG